MKKDYTPKRYQSHGDGRFERSQFRAIGENVIIEDGVLVFFPEKIELGDNIYIGHGSFLKAHYSRPDLLVVENNTWIGPGCRIYGGGGVHIGECVGVGPEVKMLTHAHDLNAKATDEPIILSPETFKPIVIEAGCDIGIGAILLPGVTIGECSIIGAGSVVTKSVPPWSVAAGNPARVIRSRR